MAFKCFRARWFSYASYPQEYDQCFFLVVRVTILFHLLLLQKPAVWADIAPLGREHFNDKIAPLNLGPVGHGHRLTTHSGRQCRDELYWPEAVEVLGAQKGKGWVLQRQKQLFMFLKEQVILQDMYDTVHGRNPANQLIGSLYTTIYRVFSSRWCRISAINSSSMFGLEATDSIWNSLQIYHF